MVSVMPDQGLEEALYTLRDVLKFHSEQPSRLQRLPMKREPVYGTIADREKRPHLVIAE